MSFWSGEKLLANGAALFRPFDQAQSDCNAYVLRVGDRYYRTADQESGQQNHQTRTILTPNQAFIIPSGQFAFLFSKETIHIPDNAMGFISMRTKIKFYGLINVSGFHVDPGYSGHLVYAVYNASPSPIHLAENDLAFKIWICDIDRQSAAPYIKRPNDGIYDISAEMIRGMNREILSLQSLTEKIRLQGEKFENRFAQNDSVVTNLGYVWRAIQLSVFLALLAVALPTSWSLGKYIERQIFADEPQSSEGSENNQELGSGELAAPPPATSESSTSTPAPTDDIEP